MYFCFPALQDANWLNANFIRWLATTAVQQIRNNNQALTPVESNRILRNWWHYTESGSQTINGIT